MWRLFSSALFSASFVSEEVILNQRLLARNTAAVQLLALYTNPDHHNAQRYRQTDRRTDGQTDDIMMPIAHQTASSTIG